MLCAYRLATVQLTRLSRRRRSAYSLASACCALTVVRQHRRKKYPWGALRLNSLHFRNNPTAKFAKHRLFCKRQRFYRSWSSRQESGGSSACGNEIVAKRRCLAFRRSRAKRTPPARRRTSLNRVKCTNANTYHVRTSGIIPPYKKPESKGRLRSPLARLSPLSFVVQRKIEPPEGAG